METFGKRLKIALDINNMKPIEFADKMKLDRSVISKYLSGKFVPKHSRMVEMAEILHVSVQWLDGYDVPMDESLPINKEDVFVKWYNENEHEINENDKEMFINFLQSYINNKKGKK